jgi:tripartite-type tricarboxylate transporter receptor subunit TctC
VTRRLLAALIAFAIALGVAPVHAQTYPNRPIKLIVPFPAGGPIDVMARLLAQKLSAGFGNVMVENRPGGGSTVGLKSVATAEPDGYTFLFGGTMTMSVFPPLLRGPEGDAIRAMTPVSLVSSTPFVLIVAPRVPATTVQELVAYAKANPGKLNFGAPAGATPLLVGERFKMKAGINFTTVPYRGAATTMNDMLTGSIFSLIPQLVCIGPMFRKNTQNLWAPRRKLLTEQRKPQSRRHAPSLLPACAIRRAPSSSPLSNLFWLARNP